MTNVCWFTPGNGLMQPQSELFGVKCLDQQLSSSTSTFVSLSTSIDHSPLEVEPSTVPPALTTVETTVVSIFQSICHDLIITCKKLNCKSWMVFSKHECTSLLWWFYLASYPECLRNVCIKSPWNKTNIINTATHKTYYQVLYLIHIERSLFLNAADSALTYDGNILWVALDFITCNSWKWKQKRICKYHRDIWVNQTLFY